jgi:hypothetical protein
MAGNLNSFPVKPWYLHRWPWLLMLGPFLVVLAGSYTGWLAFSQADALVVGDYYTQGKAINQDLRRERAAVALGLSLELTYDAADGQLRGKVHSGAALAPGKLVLHLVHATLPSKDLRFELTPDADGGFALPLPMLERTQWQVTLENAARDWRLGGNWSWPAQRVIALQAAPN